MGRNNNHDNKRAGARQEPHEGSKKSKLDPKNDKKFRYGNYNRYYGYRNANNDKDKRIAVFEKEWFCGKCCLDIGCNVGHLTLWLSKNFKVKSMKGVDIDPNLINAAKNNIIHYLDEKNLNQTMTGDDTVLKDSCGNITGTTVKDSVCQSVDNKHRASDNTTVNVEDRQKTDLFPYNVKFVTENFVPASDNILKYVKPQFDVITCLSVTKWIQLNEGDAGVKRLFKKIYLLLNDHGIFIMEPQPFSSYKRRKNLTSQIRENYEKIKLVPEKYVEFLLSEEVGFTSVEQIGKTDHEKEGFQRSIFVLRK